MSINTNCRTHLKVEGKSIKFVLRPPKWWSGHSGCIHSSVHTPSLSELHDTMLVSFSEQFSQYAIDPTQVTLEYRKAEESALVHENVLFSDSDVIEAVRDAQHFGDLDTVRTVYLYLLVPTVMVPKERRQCTECGLLFPSRMQLFTHLRQTGHGGVGSAEHVPCHTRQVHDNAAFKQYYTAQQICDSETQLAELYEHCKVALPRTIRVNKSSRLGQRAMARLVQRQACTLTPLSWCPECFMVDECTEDGKRWLGALQEAGMLQRQEQVMRLCAHLMSLGRAAPCQVSCIPVLALHLAPSHLVLDLCAAPGSKTLQGLDLPRPSD